jgi:hypothetical protein
MILLKDTVEVDSLVKSALASCASCLCTRELEQRTTTLWYNAGDQLITSNGFGTIDTLAALAVRCKISFCPIEAVKFIQKKLK